MLSLCNSLYVVIMEESVWMGSTGFAVSAHLDLQDLTVESVSKYICKYLKYDYEYS